MIPVNEPLAVPPWVRVLVPRSAQQPVAMRQLVLCSVPASAHSVVL
jgi:hypothetical protein